MINVKRNYYYVQAWYSVLYKQFITNYLPLPLTILWFILAISTEFIPKGSFYFQILVKEIKMYQFSYFQCFLLILFMSYLIRFIYKMTILYLPWFIARPVEVIMGVLYELIMLMGNMCSAVRHALKYILHQDVYRLLRIILIILKTIFSFLFILYGTVNKIIDVFCFPTHAK